MRSLPFIFRLGFWVTMLGVPFRNFSLLEGDLWEGSGALMWWAGRNINNLRIFEDRTGRLIDINSGRVMAQTSALSGSPHADPNSGFNISHSLSLPYKHQCGPSLDSLFLGNEGVEHVQQWWTARQCHITGRKHPLPHYESPLCNLSLCSAGLELGQPCWSVYFPRFPFCFREFVPLILSSSYRSRWMKISHLSEICLWSHFTMWQGASAHAS